MDEFCRGRSRIFFVPCYPEAYEIDPFGTAAGHSELDFEPANTSANVCQLPWDLGDFRSHSAGFSSLAVRHELCSDVCPPTGLSQNRRRPSTGIRLPAFIP